MKEAGIECAGAYALRPGSASQGHYSRKLKRTMGYDDCKEIYELDIPGHRKHDLERTSHATATLPLHEQVAKHLETDVGTLTALAERIAADDLPEVYKNHEVVLANPDKQVVPLALFVDAVPYAANDSCLGWWCVSLLTGRRFLYGVQRKRYVCRCGCKGWCSYHPMLEFTSWSVRALAAGRMPDCRHNNEE